MTTSGKGKEMQAFDVHAFCSVRIKIQGVAADTPEEAMKQMSEDASVYDEASRLIDRHGMDGRIQDIEFQASEPASAFQVDPVDPAAREANPDGWAYRNDENGEPQLVTFLIPSEYQDAVIEGFAGDRLINADDDVSRAARRLRRSGHPVGAALFEQLQGCSDRTAAIRMIDDLVNTLGKVNDRLSRSRPDIRPDGIEQ